MQTFDPMLELPFQRIPTQALANIPADTRMKSDLMMLRSSTLRSASPAERQFVETMTVTLGRLLLPHLDPAR